MSEPVYLFLDSVMKINLLRSSGFSPLSYILYFTLITLKSLNHQRLSFTFSFGSAAFCSSWPLLTQLQNLILQILPCCNLLNFFSSHLTWKWNIQFIVPFFLLEFYICYNTCTRRKKLLYIWSQIFIQTTLLLW